MGKTNYGKGAPEHLGHVTSRKVTNAAGFSSQKALGRDTEPGAAQGAPFHDADKKDDGTVRRHGPYRNNPYNPHDQNEAGVLGSDLTRTDPTRDSPVPTRATHAHADIAALKLKDASGVPGTLDRFPADGVLGKT